MAFSFLQKMPRISAKLFNRSKIPTEFRALSRKEVCAKSLPIGENEDSDKPIEFLKSDAAKLTALQIRSGTSQSFPWYQPYVISFSLAIFMVYFFMLREENDVDIDLSRNLYDRVSGLEEKNLEVVLDYNRSNKLPTEDIERRLEEIRSKK